MKVLLALLLVVSCLFGAVDLNTASKEELMQVKGVGAVKAQAIIDYRAKKPFESVQELGNVKGFGVKTLQKVQSEFIVTKEPAQSNNAQKTAQ